MQVVDVHFRDLPPCSGQWQVNLNTGIATCIPGPASEPCHCTLAVVLAIIALILIAALAWWFLMRDHPRRLRITQIDGQTHWPDPRRLTMPIAGILPGATGTFAETPLPPGSALPAGVIPQWTSSDTANAPVTASADGTTATVPIANPTPITSFTLTVTAQLPSGTAISGSATVPILAPQPTSLQIDQTS